MKVPFTHHWFPAGGSASCQLKVQNGAILSVCPATSLGDDAVEYICVLEEQPAITDSGLGVEQAELRFKVVIARTLEYGYEDWPTVGIAVGQKQQLFMVLLNLEDKNIEDVPVDERKGNFQTLKLSLKGQESQFTVCLRQLW